MAPPWIGGSIPIMPPGPTDKDSQLAGAAKTLASTQLGATALPPRTTTPVVGEVLLFVPTLSVRSHAAPRPPPTRLQARVVWWGEEAPTQPHEQQGTLLFPRVLEGATSSKAPLLAMMRAAGGGRAPEPRSRETACLWPVRVEEGALWAYLGDMVGCSGSIHVVCYYFTGILIRTINKRTHHLKRVASSSASRTPTPAGRTPPRPCPLRSSGASSALPSGCSGCPCTTAWRARMT